MDITALLASEFSTDRAIVDRIIGLIDEGNTIPFIARYRKEMTGAMDDQKLREMSERLDYLRGLAGEHGDAGVRLDERLLVIPEVFQLDGFDLHGRNRPVRLLQTARSEEGSRGPEPAAASGG